MDLTFERGSASEPRGHALLYFRGARDRSEVLASYLIIPPVPLNLSRYMPPMFSANLPPSQMQQVSGVPLPPVPEKVESYPYLRQLAELRDDDLIYAGTLDADDIQRGMMLAAEGAQRYHSLYADYLARSVMPAVAEAEEQEESAGVSDVIYGLMSERQRLGEMAKLTGQLRYAVDGNDTRGIRDTVREMEALSHHVPDKYRLDDLIVAAQLPGPRGQRLSQLYVDRCYRLADEDYASLKSIEEEIRSLQE
jgi:hypothetical protein